MKKNAQQGAGHHFLPAASYVGARYLLVLILAASSVTAMASTKHVRCELLTKDNKEKLIIATIDDASENAEVQMFVTSAPCAIKSSCSTEVYKKIVLPSVIRMTHVLGTGPTMTSVIDIDRSSLSVTATSTVETAMGNTESISRGQCSVEVDNTKKAL